MARDLPAGGACHLAVERGLVGEHCIGHEFTSFVLGLYNTAGPGQPIADEDRAAIWALVS